MGGMINSNDIGSSSLYSEDPIYGIKRKLEQELKDNPDNHFVSVKYRPFSKKDYPYFYNEEDNRHYTVFIEREGLSGHKYTTKFAPISESRIDEFIEKLNEPMYLLKK